MSADNRVGKYSEMLRIRLIEEAIAVLYTEQEMRCTVHLSIGQESVAVGACSALKTSDWVFSGHRNHAHYLAKGGDLKRMFAEIYGKATGCSGGKGGSMHLIDINAGFLGATPIVGSTIPIAVGAALSTKMKCETRVVVTFFGDGATETGVFHESLNFAVLKKLPVLFICENNLYSVYSPLEVRQPKERSIASLASGHGIKVEQGDGNDIDLVSQLCRDSCDMIRSGHGPLFLEFSTYRYREHCGPNFDNDLGYRTLTEYEAWKAHDPVFNFATKLCLEGKIDLQRIEEIKRDIQKEIDEAISFAKNSDLPLPSSLFTEVYA